MTAKERLKQMAEEAQERINQRQKQTETEIAEIKSQESKLNAKEMLAQRAEQARKNIETNIQKNLQKQKELDDFIKNTDLSKVQGLKLPNASSSTLQNLRNKSQVVTPQEVKEIRDLAKEYDSLPEINKIGFETYKKAVENNWADSPNIPQRSVANQMGLKSKEENDWLKTPENLKDNLRRLEDGYNFGDVTKTIGETAGETLLDIGATVAELPTRAVKGALSVSEGIAQASASVIAGVSDLIGQDKFANALRKQIANTNPITGGINKFNENLDKYTFTGETLDSTSEGIGQSLAQMATGYALNAVKIPATIPIKFGKHVLNMPITAFIAGTGSSAQETYQKAEQQLNGIENATWKEKVQMSLKIVGGGAIEGVAEGMFGLLGVGGSDITDEIAKKAISRATTAFDKQLVNIMIAGGGEALEEFISYAGNWLWNNGIVNNLGDIDYSQNWNWDDVMQQMTSAFLSAGISQGGTSIIQTNKATQNAEKYAQQLVGRTLTQDEKTEIKNNVTDMVLGAKQNLEKQSMYPATQKAIDTQIVDETKRRNIEYLKNKYGLNVNQDGTMSNQPTNVIDRLKQKYNLQNEEYNIADTNLKTTPQNYTNFEKTTPINENISQKNVQNVPNLQKTVQNNSTIQGLEDYTEQDIKDLVSDYIEDITNEKISDIALINEDGNIKAKVYYNGNLNEIESLEVEGKQIKIEQQRYEESDVFEDRASYDVDITEENEYNTEKREVARKPETRNYTYKKIEPRDIARVNSDYMTNEIKYADDVGVVNFDDVSYAYEKTDDGINVLLKFKGSQNYIKGVTEYVRANSNTRPKGYNRYVEIARNRYANNNISDADGRRTRKSEESNIETDRTRRQGRKDDIAENVKNNGNNIENPEEQGSFSISESDNVRYDTIPVLKDGFYSQLENVIINKMQRQAKAEDVMNLIRKNGVKQDEIDWTGIDDFLANKETVTKDEVIEYISANQIEIEEVVKDDGQKARYEQREDEIRKEMDDLYYEAFKIMEKYNIYMRVGDPFDTMDVFLAEHGEDEIYNLVDLESFAKKADGEYYLDGETGEIFTLDEMHREIDSLYDLYNQRRDLEEELEEIPETSYGYADDFEDATKFKRFATKFSDMGENYREILFRLPNAKGAKPYYKREHWGDISNIFAHTRLQDYKDKNGNNVLFIEEIQSDMHQEGRKQGYARNFGKINENLESVEKERAKLRRTLVGEQYQNIVKINERQKEIDDEMGKIIHKYFSPVIDNHDVIETFYDIIVTLELKTDEQSNTKSYSGKTKIDLKYLQDKDIEPLKGLIHLSQEDLKQYVLLHNEMYANSRKAQRINKETTEILDNNEELKKLDSQIKELEKEKRSNYGKIDALFPFKKNWHEFVLRKIINEAVKQGYDKVAWTTGEQQADRYELNQYIKSMIYIKNEDGTYDIVLGGNSFNNNNFSNYPEEKLEELVGRNIANKMINNEGTTQMFSSFFHDDIEKEWRRLEGFELKTGGEGMKGFYDKIIPEYLSKYLKKWNSKLEEVIIPDSQGVKHVQQGFTITPEMIESIRQTGQSLYERPRKNHTEYENQMKLNMDVTTEVVESAKNYNGGLKPIVIGHRIWEGYKKQGYIDLNNTKVSTAQDMAEIAQIFRNPYYETFRVIYTKGKGKSKVIVGQEALSSFLPSSVNIVNKDNTLMKMTYQMKDRMQRLSADGYYLIHNHPSGEATASQNDIRLTEKIAQKVPGFHEHIIVDHGTYAYIYMTLPGLSTGGKAVAVDNLDVDSSNSTYNQEDFSNDIVNGGMYINTRGVLVELASNIRHDENYSSLILTDVKHKLNAIIDMPNAMFNMKPEQVEGYIKNTAKKYGANEAFIATQDDAVFKKLKKTLSNIRDIVLYDKTIGVRAGEQGESVFYKEETSSKRTSMRVSEETKEERIERVRKYVEETQKSIGTLGADVSRKDIVTRIIENYGITTKGNSKELNRVSKEIQELIKKGSFTDNKIKGYAEQLIENLKVTIDDYYKANKELKELIRRTKLYASDSVKAGFVDWADFRKSNVGTIRATNDADALPVDTFYQELSEMYGEVFFPSDIINSSDQLKKIADVAKQIKVIDMTLKQNIDENFGEVARQEIVNGLIENFETLREQMTGEIKDVVETPEIKTRRWSKTVRNNDMVQTFLDKDLQDYKYVVRSNKATIAQANETLMRKGYDESIKYFDAVVESGKFPTVDDIALGERLIQESIKRGEFEKATEIIADVTILGTELGQAVQAMSMISRLSPAGQLMYLERAVKRINEKQQTKRKKPSKKKKTGLDKVMDEGKVGDVDIEITKEMKEEILSAKTPEELEIAVTRVKEQIAAQLPVEVAEKLSEWRYLAMLGNPKTHIRNTVGNLVMVAPYEMKNLYQRIIETTFNSNLEERTKTFKKSSEVVKSFVEDMVEQNKDTLTGNGYTNIQSELKNMRKIYKTKVLETLKKANMKALDFEDFVFKKRAFKSTLAEYLTANGIRTEKDIQENPELIQKGINFAIEEAKKATFNQYNSVATAISRFESDKTIGKILVGGLAPFKRTPLNIVKTAWQYSPAGLAETLTLRTRDLKNGLITANDYIERISQGLTGVSITAIGFLLASMGVLTGSMGSKKKDKYEQSIGLRVPYSIKAGDRYIDISWLSPSAIPLLIGAELYSLADDGESGLSIDGIVKVVEKMMNPISEMTMLSTFNDALINYAGEDNEISGLAGILDTVVKSYIGQAFPTLGSQINKIIDPTVRTTKVSKNSKFKTGEQIVRTNINKIVGLSYLLEPSTDVWGNVQKRSDNVVLRSIDSLFNPASVVENKSTSVDKEIMKLYEINQNDDIIPKIPNNYFTLNGYKYEFSAEEYTDFKITYGQTAYKELQKLFRTAEYKGMTTEDKEKSIKEVYDLAQQKAREEYGITPDTLIREYGEKEAANRLLEGKQVQKYEMAKNNIGLNLKQYYEAYSAQKGVTGKKDTKGNTISGTEKTNRINEMEKTGLTKSQATQLYKILEGKL